MHIATISFSPKQSDGIQTETGPWVVLTSELWPGTVQEAVLAEKPCDHLNNLTTQTVKLLHARLKPNILNLLTLL